MGINYQHAKILWEARLRGASFKDTLTIAHLSLKLHPAEVTLLRRVYRASFPQSKTTPLMNYKFGDFSDEFLRDFLGATSITMLDYSDYEGANLIHDLNQPVPDHLLERFDTVIEAGSLEHVFNFPVAIANLMKMLKVGGNIFITTPANNLCGHGFYQFSPELMFRIFAPENGFALRRIILFEALFPSVELTSNRNVYEVTDPAQVRSRVGLVSRGPVMMMVEAQKTSDTSVFAHSLLQSDYVSLWNQERTLSSYTGIKKGLKQVFKRLPFSLQARIKGYRETKLFSFANARFYKKLAI